jgi:hypothetical protein
VASSIDLFVQLSIQPTLSPIHCVVGRNESDPGSILGDQDQSRRVELEATRVTQRSEKSCLQGVRSVTAYGGALDPRDAEGVVVEDEGATIAIAEAATTGARRIHREADSRPPAWNEISARRI